ncbi:MAG: hypothetical protein M1381_10850 [Deltaproteobacteria bacterium]|nr:hypothetical protein [Deltaproteobacteria bacterium]MCL5792391.1 hypothetical protein [Deltaproteobacteria bacterium]
MKAYKNNNRKMYESVKVFMLGSIVAGFVIGCASVPTAPIAGQRTVIKESGNMPDWF